MNFLYHQIHVQYKEQGDSILLAYLQWFFSVWLLVQIHIVWQHGIVLTFQIVSFLFVYWTYFCLAPFFRYPSCAVRCIKQFSQAAYHCLISRFVYFIWVMSHPGAFPFLLLSTALFTSSSAISSSSQSKPCFCLA